MTRKEEICDVTKEQFTYVKDENLKSALRFAFIDGAKWADEHPNLESLWHDASEEPLLEDKVIVFLDELNFAHISEKFGGTFSYMLEDLSWEEYVKFLRISKWAYLDDLLPKQFRNPEQLKGG